jgi:iron(III) transport system permease protein
MPDATLAAPAITHRPAIRRAAIAHCPAIRRLRWSFGWWTMAALAAAGAVGVPLLAVVGLALFPADDIWSHLAATVLPGYVRTTMALLLGVGALALLLGVATAWLVTMYRFPGRRVFEWALLLPLAVPAYVVAYVYTDVLEYAGPVQVLLREAFGWTSRRDYWFPEIRSLGGAVAMLGLVLYPYVYLLARAAFLEQSACALEVGRTLGCGPVGSFFRVALPLARPAIVVGVALVMMETLNDFGTVQHFAVATLTAGVYDVWLSMNSTAGAAQLSLVMLAFVLILLAAERLARRGRRFHHTTARWRRPCACRLSGVRGALATTACAAAVVLGFALPAAVLVFYSLRTGSPFAGRFADYLLNSLLLSGSAALVAVGLGLVLAYAARLARDRLVTGAVRFAALGYALPGAVLAVGVVVPFATFDNALDGLARQHLGVSTGLLLSGTLVALGFGFIVRFLALALGSCEAGLARITPSMEGAARSLGAAPGRMLLRVHLPMLKTALLTATILVFVDSMKELPMTVLLRPFNFETLATHVYQYAAQDRFEESAAGALAIVGFGMLPVILLSRTIRRARSADGG